MLIPVVMLMSLVAVLAYAVNREKGVNTVLQGRESDIDHARYAAEAGLLALNARVQSLGCSATYPTAASPWSQSAFGSAAYSAYATTATGNTLTLVSTGTYKGSSVTVRRSNVIVYQSATQSQSLAPGSTGIDTYIREGSNTNFGDESRMRLKKSERYPLIQFDLAAIPLKSLVTEALLRIYFDSPDGGATVSAYRVQSFWQEGNGQSSSGANWTRRSSSAFWSSSGGDFHSTHVSESPIYYSYSWYLGTYYYIELDITEATNAWMLGRFPNYGVLLKSSSTENHYLYSSDTSSSDFRPALTVTYYPPCTY